MPIGQKVEDLKSANERWVAGVHTEPNFFAISAYYCLAFCLCILEFTDRKHNKE